MAQYAVGTKFPSVSKKPNVECSADLLFYAKRDIKVGKESTVDYDNYSE